MLELRYKGCPHCLTSAKATLRTIGFFEGRDYKIAFHVDHRNDNIYKVRPEYLKRFSGAILYNPKTEKWIDFYNKDASKRQLEVKNRADADRVRSIIVSLSNGS